MFKTILQSRGKTLREFAEELGISEVHMSMINTGARRPSWDLAVAIGGKLGIKAEDVMNHKDSAM